MTTIDTAPPVMNTDLPSLCLFPVKNKKPLMKGWQKSSPIEMCRIVEWETQHLGCGWGAAIDAGMMVVDCDSDAALSALYDLGDPHGIFPATLITMTPRGYHLWFRLPSGLKVRNRVALMPGVDIRAKGGFVVVPPTDGYSFVDMSVPIANAPPWLLGMVNGEALTASDSPSPQALSEPVANLIDLTQLTLFELDIVTRGWEERIARLLGAPGKVADGRSPFSLKVALEPQNVKKGERNAALYAYACRLRGEGKPESTIRDEVWRAATRIPEPLPKFEVEKIIQSAMRHDARTVGNNTLMRAWRVVEQIELGPSATKFYRFLLLVEQLLELKPKNKSGVLLPVRAIAVLMNTHFNQVSKWRLKAEKLGVIKKRTKYVRRRLADEFEVKAGFSPLRDGPEMYKQKRGRKPKTVKISAELEEVA